MSSFDLPRAHPQHWRPLGAALAMGALATFALGSVTSAQSASPAAGGGEAYTINASTTDLGTFLTGEDGKTLYYFAKDTAPGASTCTGDCATNWPALTVDSADTLAAGNGVTGVLATFARADGSTQVSYDGRPLYYFAADKAAGDTNGQGKGGVWAVASVDGSLGVATPSAAAPSGTVYTVNATTTDLGTFLTGEDGKTLYFFAMDTAPGASVCGDDGGCKANWPPFTLDAGEALAAGDGVTGVLSTFTRADGSTQVTFDGRPVYYFIGDQKAGDVTGQGIGGIWFVAAANGSLPAPAASGAPASSPVAKTSY